MPEFEYDPRKSRSNLEKHGLDFDDAQELWGVKHVVFRAKDVSGEQRFAIIGRIRGRAWVAIFTFRQDLVRIISCRRADYKLESQYASHLEEATA